MANILFLLLYIYIICQCNYLVSKPEPVLNITFADCFNMMIEIKDGLTTEAIRDVFIYKKNDQRQFIYYISRDYSSAKDILSMLISSQSTVNQIVFLKPGIVIPSLEVKIQTNTQKGHTYSFDECLIYDAIEHCYYFKSTFHIIIIGNSFDPSHPVENQPFCMTLNYKLNDNLFIYRLNLYVYIPQKILLYTYRKDYHDAEASKIYTVNVSWKSKLNTSLTFNLSTVCWNKFKSTDANFTYEWDVSTQNKRSNSYRKRIQTLFVLPEMNKFKNRFEQGKKNDFVSKPEPIVKITFTDCFNMMIEIKDGLLTEAIRDVYIYKKNDQRQFIYYISRDKSDAKGIFEFLIMPQSTVNHIVFFKPEIIVPSFDIMIQLNTQKGNTYSFHEILMYDAIEQCYYFENMYHIIIIKTSFDPPHPVENKPFCMTLNYKLNDNLLIYRLNLYAYIPQKILLYTYTKGYHDAKESKIYTTDVSWKSKLSTSLAFNLSTVCWNKFKSTDANFTYEWDVSTQSKRSNSYRKRIQTPFELPQMSQFENPFEQGKNNDQTTIIGLVTAIVIIIILIICFTKTKDLLNKYTYITIKPEMPSIRKAT